jgi:Protein of unknown function (DUF2783)
MTHTTAKPPTAAFDVLEQAYDRIAGGIDTAGPAQETVFLAKLALALANEIGDAHVISACVDAALKDLKG